MAGFVYVAKKDDLEYDGEDICVEFNSGDSFIYIPIELITEAVEEYEDESCNEGGGFSDRDSAHQMDQARGLK